MKAAFWLLAALFFCSQAVAPAQQTGAPHGADPATVPVHLGDAAVPLPGPWRFRVGDDPQWAQPGFDDSSWQNVKLSAAGAGQVPGWTTQGHPDYAGYGWYRLWVDVEGADHALELKMPDAVDDAYQVFVNGRWIGQFGDFSHRRVRAFAAMPEGFQLPRNLHNGPMLIAVRCGWTARRAFLGPRSAACVRHLYWGWSRRSPDRYSWIGTMWGTGSAAGF